MTKRRGRPQIEEERRSVPIGLNVTPAVKRRLEWIATEERMSQTEMITQMINDRAEDLALTQARVDRPRSIREFLKMRWLEVIDAGALPIDVLIDLRQGRLAQEEEVLLIAGALKIDADYLLGLERNGHENGITKLPS